MGCEGRSAAPTDFHHQTPLLPRVAASCSSHALQIGWMHDLSGGSCDRLCETVALAKLVITLQQMPANVTITELFFSLDLTDLILTPCILSRLPVFAPLSRLNLPFYQPIETAASNIPYRNPIIARILIRPFPL
jgi:hypothetical protein